MCAGSVDLSSTTFAMKDRPAPGADPSRTA
jgi:hypothetical protein